MDAFSSNRRGSVGVLYQVFVTVEQDEAIQERARELALKGKILDYRRNRPVVPDKKGAVARYAIAKYALLSLANGGVKNMGKRGKNS